MRSVATQKQAGADPLREQGTGPVFLLGYTLFLITLKFLLVSYGQKSAVSC